ncbi:MAG TPA: hypothetical protein VGK67_27295 [Myxococcales bacterium]|jgi:hypothetical protein
MIRRLLLTVAASLLAVACGRQVLPTPDAGPHVIALDPDSMAPPNDQCLEPIGLPDCSELRLLAGAVIDDDVNENLYVRWFVDGDFKDQALLSPAQPPSTRRLGPSFSFLPQPYARAAHVVKVVVSNGFSQTGDSTQLAEGKTSAEWTWCVDTTKCENGAGAGR